MEKRKREFTYNTKTKISVAIFDYNLHGIFLKLQRDIRKAN